MTAGRNCSRFDEKKEGVFVHWLGGGSLPLGGQVIWLDGAFAYRCN